MHFPPYVTADILIHRVISLAVVWRVGKKKVCKCDVIIHRNRKNMHINDNSENGIQSCGKCISFMMQFFFRNIFTIFRSINFTMSVLWEESFASFLAAIHQFWQ